MAADVWSHIGFARVGALLGERAGLRFAPNRQPAAEAAMRRVMRDLHLADPLRLARRAEHDAAVLDALLAETTVGETYFFREPAQLDYIRREVLPTFRGLRSPQRPLRTWSAGCASGEEAYTLAILLYEAGWRDAGRVLGTDISRPRLLAAERARYTRWSMRGVAPETVARYFIARGPHFYLRPELRAMADFRALNLATDDFPSAASGIGEMDVVLCRNVLIYLDRATVAAVARRLLASLSEEGWLFLGASDPMLGELVPCETVVTGAGLAYRRLDVALPRPRVWVHREPPAPPEPPTAAAPSAAPAASTAPAAPAAPAASGTAAVEPPPEVTRAPS
ncbi:MAG TPA: protein-glutamate O-methyltransferase CheR, partial [Gemmatimonadaceae bacterium]|nr:protein-glutamate O-methyltransferase CheR [Gemmatimonadaceae bacterium]